MTDLLNAAAAYVGAPYRLLGRDPAGWDCWGCVRWLRQALLGRASPCWSETYGLQDTFDGGLPAKAEALIARNLSAWRACPAPAPGQVVLLTVFGRAAHVGLVLTPEVFIHAWEGVDTVIERLDDQRWARRIGGFYDA